MPLVDDDLLDRDSGGPSPASYHAGQADRAKDTTESQRQTDRERERIGTSNLRAPFVV